MQNDIILDDSERQSCEVWTRVMGYYRPVLTIDGGSRYNIGKQSEYKERTFFKQVT